MADPAASFAALRPLMGEAIRLQQQGKYADAERLYAQVLEMAPELPDVHHFMGLLAHQMGRQGLADEHMRRSLELAPGRADFHFNHAQMLTGRQRLPEAARAFQQALDIDPKMTDAWQGLGMTLHALDRDMPAVACFQRALELAPDRAGALQPLGECFQSMSMLPEAVEAYRRAASLAPGDAHLQVLLAGALGELRRDPEARAALDKALELAPDLPEAHYARGVWFANKGDFMAARSALEKALELAPEYYQAALYYAYITPLSPDAPLVRRLSARAQKGDWNDPGQGANFHYTLGYVLDKDEQYDAAFGHYLEANRLQRSLHDYSTGSQRTLQLSMQQAFGTAFLERARHFGNSSAKPLFIIGMPRSGTSLVEQILASHPEVYGGGEMLFLHADLRRCLGLQFLDAFAAGVAGLPNAELAAVAASLLAHLDELAPAARYVTDKMPSNFMLLGLLHALFPNARFIHCRRDPLDTCVSCFTTSFKQGHKFTNDLKELGQYYRLYEQAMTHWWALIPAEKLYEISYEKLVVEPETEVRKLLEFCDLEWDAACLRFHENTRAVSTASVLQVRQPVYRSAIGRWRRFAQHLGPLQEALSDASLV